MELPNPAIYMLIFSPMKSCFEATISDIMQSLLFLGFQVQRKAFTKGGLAAHAVTRYKVLVKLLDQATSPSATTGDGLYTC